MKTQTCACCSKDFNIFVKIDEKWRNLSNRKFCLSCSPFGTKDRRHPNERAKDILGYRICSKCQEQKLLIVHFVKSKHEKIWF